MTVYNGKIAIWYVHGRTVSENTIQQIISTLKQYAPAVAQVWVKIGEADEWMGNIAGGDPKPDLAIRSTADIDRWVQQLANAGLEFHAWHIPKGINPQREADFVANAINRPGVRSYIMDVEPFSGYWVGGKNNIGPFMRQLRSRLPADFHIGMSVDPRPWHQASIFPQEWRPFINSLHPQTYWGDFTQTPDAALKMVYDTWGSYGVPIIPVLQAYQGRGNKITRSEMDRARTVAINTYKAPGISWFRFGTISSSMFPAVNVKVDGSVPTGGTTTTNGNYGPEIVVKVGDPGYREGSYDGSPPRLTSFTNEEGWTARYAQTSNATSNLWVRWEARLPASGWYEISAYVAAQHGSTANARYKVNGVAGQTADLEVRIAQVVIDALWVPLGIFPFDISRPNAGVIFLNDLTGELGREISFDALRWRQVNGWNQPPRYLVDGYDSPIGTADERQIPGGTTWPASWYSTNPYGNVYSLLGKQTIHTGDDLFLRRGRTFGQPVFAIASGTVTSARREGTGSWGDVIVIRHDPYAKTGQVVYSRYSHVTQMEVRPGDRVVRGQQIAVVGDAYGVFAAYPHLHFDISPTRVLESSPGDWPGTDRGRIERDYLNPRTFIYGNRPDKP